MIALYFGSSKTDEQGAVFCLKKQAISRSFSFSQALHAIKDQRDITPCIIDPLGAVLNDLDDQKPKRQKAVYILHRDLRASH